MDNDREEIILIKSPTEQRIFTVSKKCNILILPTPVLTEEDSFGCFGSIQYTRTNLKIDGRTVFK